MSLSYPYTFKINGTAFGSKVKRYSYKTTYTPVYSETVTTMDKKDHAVIVRWRHGLSVDMMPMSESDLASLQTALAGSNIATIKFASLQLNSEVETQMMLSPVSADLILKNASRRVLGNIPLQFTEL